MGVSLGVVSIFVIFSSIVAYFLGKYLRMVYLVSRFPGPFAFPILGNTYRMNGDLRELFVGFTEDMNKFREKSGGILRYWLGPAPSLVIYGADHMEVILNSSRHLKKGYLYMFLEPWLGKGLLTSEGQKWFQRRKMLTPTFHFAILQNFVEVFNEQSDILVRKLEKFADKPEPVNIFPPITHCVLDIICDTAMGKSMKAQDDSYNEYVEAVVSTTDIVTQRGFKPWLWPDFMFEKVNLGKQHEQNIRILHGVTNMTMRGRLQEHPRKVQEAGEDGFAVMIRERLQEPPRKVREAGEGEFAGRSKRIAFLDLLLQIHREDKSFTLEDIREEVDTFMFEGHDTTAAAVSWATLLIGQHSEVQARLHEEIDDVFGNSDRPVTSDDLAKLPYLSRVVKESLRIMPSVFFILRDLDSDIVLDGKLVPKEAVIFLNLYGLHQDPKYFPDPQRFDPDRFLPENVAKRHPFAYVPFSAGPRNCIGQKFATMEDKIILINILRRFTIESLQTLEEAKPAGQIIIRPLDGKLLVKLKTRK